MGLRRIGREAAMQFLYAMDLGNQSREAQQLFWNNMRASPAARSFAQHLVQGVMNQKSFIDPIIEKNATHWRLDRINHVDRNILRIAIFELYFSKETPVPVVINEALDIARKYGTRKSTAFVNGVLDRVARTRVDAEQEKEKKT